MATWGMGRYGDAAAAAAERMGLDVYWRSVTINERSYIILCSEIEHPIKIPHMLSKGGFTVRS